MLININDTYEDFHYQDEETEIVKVPNYSDEQIRAIESDAQHKIIIAGAGAGKTGLVAEMVKRDMKTNKKVLAITFTNKATNELRDRCETWEDTLTVSTIHGLAWTLIKNYSEKEYLIATPYIVKKILKKLGCTDKAEYKRLGLSQLKHGSNYISCNKLYHEYHDYCEKKLYIDFNSLTFKALPYVQENMYDAFYGDEWQDFDANQYEFFTKMIDMAPGSSSVVVGDSRQKIYEWRGAMADSFVHYQAKYNAVQFHLTKNFRSDEPVVNLANWMTIEKHLPEMTIGKENQEGGNFFLKEYRDPKTETIKTARLVAAIDKKGERCAVLFRTGIALKMFEAEIIKHQVNYETWGALPLLDYKAIKAVTAWLSVLNNPADQMFFEEAVQSVKGFGVAFATKVTFEMAEQAHTKANEIPEFGEFNDKEEQTPQFLKKLVKIYDIFLKCFDEWEKGTDDLIIYLSSIVSEDFSTDQNKERLVNLCEFVKTFDSIHDFCQNAVLVDPAKEKNKANIILTTVFKAKGLQFKNVVIPYCNDGMFPMKNSKNIPEENKVLYTGITRAEKNVFITFTGNKSRFLT